MHSRNYPATKETGHEISAKAERIPYLRCSTRFDSSL